MEFCLTLTVEFGGFDYGLNHYTDGGGEATWVAYVSSRQPRGPLCLEPDFDVASPCQS